MPTLIELTAQTVSARDAKKKSPQPVKVVGTFLLDIYSVNTLRHRLVHMQRGLLRLRNLSG